MRSSRNSLIAPSRLALGPTAAMPEDVEDCRAIPFKFRQNGTLILGGPHLKALFMPGRPSRNSAASAGLCRELTTDSRRQGLAYMRVARLKLSIYRKDTK